MWESYADMYARHVLAPLHTAQRIREYVSACESTCCDHRSCRHVLAREASQRKYAQLRDRPLHLQGEGGAGQVGANALVVG